MLNVPMWLDRLNRTTGYRELQKVFSELVAQVQAGGENAELARSIDEAIHRLEAERTQDEQELKDVQSRYEEFRAANKGVTGWFKRHIPFTATRRQEHEHRDSVTQQTAEILADNLVIARAQMIKERVLGDTQRRLGQRPDAWRARLDATAGGPLPPLGQVLQEMTGEIDRARDFLHALKEDIDAFAGAAFQAAEDRKERDADLAAAQKELAELKHEVDTKAAMRQAGVKQLATRAAAELEQHDAAFRADGQQLAKLRTVLAHATDARTALGKLVTAATPLGALSKEFKALPTEIQQVRDGLRRLESQCGDASIACAKKAAACDEQRGRFDAAQRDMESARQVLASAQQFYDAYLAECRANQTMPVSAEAGGAAAPDSPMLRKFNEAKAAADAAQARLHQATAPYEAAKKETTAAQAALDDLQKQLSGLRDKLQTLESRTPKLRSELLAASDRTHEAFASAVTGLGAYLAGERVAGLAMFQSNDLAAGVFGCLGPRGLERGLADSLVQAERDYQRHLQGMQVLERVSKWLDAQHSAIEQQRSAANGRRDAAWQRACGELLGERLAKDACAGGLSG